MWGQIYTFMPKQGTSNPIPSRYHQRAVIFSIRVIEVINGCQLIIILILNHNMEITLVPGYAQAWNRHPTSF